MQFYKNMIYHHFHKILYFKNSCYKTVSYTHLNLTVTNGTQGVVQGSAIRDITVEVVDKYYLPEGYIDGIKGLNGLTATATDTGFKISGTPTADVNITLTEATPMPQAPTPNFTENDIKRTKSSLTVNGTFDVVTYGAVSYTHLKHTTLGTFMEMDSIAGKKIITLGYSISQKLFGFN